jgi:hypothetical protein
VLLRRSSLTDCASHVVQAALVRVVVGDQVPISVQTAQDANSSPDVFVSTVEFRDTGVIFEVTPRINSSGSVVLDIMQEVSTVGETDGSTGNPTISQRTISSSIAVDSGELSPWVACLSSVTPKAALACQAYHVSRSLVAFLDVSPHATSRPSFWS